MDKRYQIFVSSTYADLKDERQHVLQALMEMDCIPAGMELFPAADEEQWEFIKKVIDDCDYYLLIIGGRYGSITTDGINYTEKEFDYAVENDIKVVALIHESPQEIPFGKSEQDPILQEKLILFKEKVMHGRMVKFWKRAEDLPGLVALSLTKTIKMYPAVGWVRASQVPSGNLLSEINDLRKRNSLLESSLKELAPTEVQIDDLADIDSEITVHGSFKTRIPGHSEQTHKFEHTITWRRIFALIAPYLVEHPSDARVKSYLATSIQQIATSSNRGYSAAIDDQEFKTITIQLRAYGLITTDYTNTTKGGMALFWSLTKKGDSLMIQSRVMRKET